MAERTIIQSLAGATIGICATLPITHDAAGYQDTDLVFSAIGEIEDHGAHGVQAQIIEFTAVDDAIVQKLKGSKNYGTKQLVLGNIPSDAGQDILAAAAESTNRYSVKITYPLGQGETTQEIHYLEVLVSSFEFQDGQANSVRKLGVGMAVCRAPVIVAAT